MPGLFKLFYHGAFGKRNWVIWKEEHVKSVLELKRVSDRIMSLKLELKEVMLNVVSVYGPQIWILVRRKKWILEKVGSRQCRVWSCDARSRCSKTLGINNFKAKGSAAVRPATMFGLETIAEDVRYRLRRRQMIRCGDLEREQFKLDFLIRFTVWLHNQTT